MIGDTNEHVETNPISMSAANDACVTDHLANDHQTLVSEIVKVFAAFSGNVIVKPAAAKQTVAKTEQEMLGGNVPLKGAMMPPKRAVVSQTVKATWEPASLKISAKAKYTVVKHTSKHKRPATAADKTRMLPASPVLQ